MILVDSHAHLDFPTSPRKAGLRGSSADDLEVKLERARNAEVDKIITIGTTIAESKRAVEIANKYSGDTMQIYASCGIHPKDGKADVEKYGLLHCFETLKQIAKSSKNVVAIGECGLDYFTTGDPSTSFDRTQDKSLRAGTIHITSNKEKKFQRELFEGQVKLAANLGSPLIIHCRNGWGEIFDILPNVRGQLSNVSGVFHSWTGNWDAAQKALDLGFYISFSGIVTFKNAPEVQKVAKKMSLDRMLVETDSPFLTPEPFRGSKNEPKNVRITAQFLADLRGLPFAKIAEATTGNAERLFGI